jgi:hypothetical protein
VNAVRIERLESVPLAVIRRVVARPELSRVVPECCGLVWKAVRAQQTPAGRHVAVYWNVEDGNVGPGNVGSGFNRTSPGDPDSNVGSGFSRTLPRDRNVRIRLEVGVELHGPFAEQGEVVRSATPAGTVASTTHFGPYGGLGAGHEAIRRWCQENGRPLAGPSWEIYGHWQPEWNADPSLIRTDVCYLLGL